MAIAFALLFTGSQIVDHWRPFQVRQHNSLTSDVDFALRALHHRDVSSAANVTDGLMPQFSSREKDEPVFIYILYLSDQVRVLDWQLDSLDSLNRN
jgi:hypothetical protein